MPTGLPWAPPAAWALGVVTRPCLVNRKRDVSSTQGGSPPDRILPEPLGACPPTSLPSPSGTHLWVNCSDSLSGFLLQAPFPCLGHGGSVYMLIGPVYRPTSPVYTPTHPVYTLIPSCVHADWPCVHTDGSRPGCQGRAGPEASHHQAGGGGGQEGRADAPPPHRATGSEDQPSPQVTSPPNPSRLCFLRS